MADATFPVCLNDAIQDEPAVWGDTVVWRDARNAATSGTDIYSSSLLTGRESAVCTAAGDQSAPAIDHDLVVWADARSAKTKLRRARLRPHPAGAVRGRGRQGAQSRPTVSDDQVVWVDARAGVTDSVDGGPHALGRRHGDRRRPGLDAQHDGPPCASSGSKTGRVVRMTLGPTGAPARSIRSGRPRSLLLIAGDGLKTLTAVFTDLSGLSSPAMTAAITLDTHGPRVSVPANVTIASGAKVRSRFA